ncbi:MAG: ATP-binding protein [Roseovarius sp.]|nr:ATP-binding protein [Roseovarius sp.]
MDQTILKSLLDAMPLPALLIARNRRISSSNNRALELIGHEMSGRHFTTALRQPAILEAIESCFSDGGQKKARYLSTEGAQDTVYVVYCRNVDIGAEDGVLVSFEDITHLEQADQIRRDFVANVSHELRTPLTSILGFIETLAGPASDDAKVTARFLNIMHKETRRMERLVNDLLSLGRVEAQERVRPNDVVDIEKCVELALSTLDTLIEDGQINLIREFTGNAMQVLGDEDQLQQVFINLVENAVKYGGKRRKIYISVAPLNYEPVLAGSAICISVRDEGPGIEQVHIPRLTERFYRVDTHRSREMGGTGLGLAIAKHVLNRHRGVLQIESAVGKGSEFRVKLPVGKMNGE